jgi:hypothetical protein
VSFWQDVSQLPATQILSNEQSVLIEHSTQAPSTHWGFEPKQSSLLLQVVGMTQRESSHDQKHSSAQSGS